MQHVDIVPNADAEIHALHTLNPKDTAVVQADAAEAAGIKGFEPRPDSTASIILSAYHPEKWSTRILRHPTSCGVLRSILPTGKRLEMFLERSAGARFL
ncbi:MAG: hypothetical protein IPL65_02875 [Lewinellaceae bacterium]|nr:hypothetical protein [Lewinellaceae bacterium]